MLLLGCNRTLVYEIGPLYVYENTSPKRHLKSPKAFISIAYSDLKGVSISNRELDKLSSIYEGIGDKKLGESLIIQLLLGEVQDSKFDLGLWSFPPQDVFISDEGYGHPLEMLYVIASVFVVDNLGNEGITAFKAWCEQEASHALLAHPTPQSLDIQQERVALGEWRERYPDEYEAVQVYFSNVLERWKTMSSTGFVGLKERMAVEMDWRSSILQPQGSANPLILPESFEEVEGDFGSFIGTVYQTFYHRKPTEFEEWYVEKYIRETPDLSPLGLYYSMMTSDEYRYY